MSFIKYSLTFVLLSLLAGFQNTIAFYQIPNGNLSLANLKTEYKINPIGIDETKPRLSWEIISNVPGTHQTAYQIVTANSLEGLSNESQFIWNTNKVQSDQSIQVIYGGPTLKSRERVYWKVKIWDNHGNESEWSEPTFFEMGLLGPSDWQASWIEPNAIESDSTPNPSPYLRKEFSLDNPVVDARVYVSAHGLYQLHINGEKISDDQFTPGWTSYLKRLQYQVYDVTEALKKGKNAIGLILGNGWYRGQLAWNEKSNIYGDKLAAILQLHIKYENGEEAIISDNSWKSSTGPILKSEIYDGELYDARLELTGWDETGYKDSNWKGVSVSDFDKNNLVAQDGPPVQIVETIQPVKKIITPKGELVFDLGQNMVGWMEIKLKAKQGSKITLTHAEVLDKDGNFYIDNLRKADQKVQYIFSGKGLETYQPHFTFQGFRYVKVEDFEGEIDLKDLTGKVIHSAMTPIGDFECSDTLVNQLQHNIVWGLKGNFLDVPTDCPQRDERLGWTGDAQAFAPTACFNMDVASFFTKWMKDVAADQDKEGRIPHVVPDILSMTNEFGGTAGAATGWADAVTVIPWTVYQNYGDQRILETQYPAMKGWVEYMKKQAGDQYLFNTGFHFGDWLSYSSTSSAYPGAYTDTDLIATAYFYYSTEVLYKSAELIGKSDESEEYKSLAQKIKTAFQKEFVTSSGRLSPNTQTAYVLALAFDLIPEELKQASANNLAKDVKKFGHITTGFLGTPLICQVLSDNGYPELAFQLLFRKEYPGWLYPVTQGATTIWERWDGQKPDGSFQDIGMNSFNHYAYGAVGKWLYSYVAGIKTDAKDPGYKKIIIDPLVDNQLDYVSASHHSMYGEIISKWKKEGDQLNMNVTIPPNTSAEIHIPTVDKSSVMVNGVPLSDMDNIKIIYEDDESRVVETGSGEYSFATKIK